MKKVLQGKYLLVILTALFVGSFGVQTIEAKSVSWSKTESSGTFLYKWNGGDDGNTNNGFSGWSVGLKSPSITVSYTADVYNNTTGAKLSDGASVPIGTVLRFTPKAYADSDISWFGTGYSNDSPNGHWIANAGAPAVEEDCLT